MGLFLSSLYSPIGPIMTKNVCFSSPIALQHKISSLPNFMEISVKTFIGSHSSSILISLFNHFDFLSISYQNGEKLCTLLFWGGAGVLHKLEQCRLHSACLITAFIIDCFEEDLTSLWYWVLLYVKMVNLYISLLYYLAIKSISFTHIFY